MKNFLERWRELNPCIKKLGLIMRLSSLLILLAVFSSTASVYSQATKLTLKMENARIADVFDAIEQQSEFYFFYNRDYFNDQREVSVDFENKKVDEILQKLFEEENVEYEIVDRNILIKVPKTVAENSGKTVQQQRTVSGTVTDESGEPLPGVTVLIKGTTQGTVTNADGNYSLVNIPDDATLVFSFVGMLTREINVDNQTEINVSMEMDAIGIEEVVAIGYGTLRKKDLTGAVSNVNVEQLSEISSVSVMQNLQGSVSGLNVGAVDRAGEDPLLSIRGQNTLSSDAGSNAPLIVVDGIIFRGSMVDLNVADIESIDILKDISSAAIYGSQASNGVILVTTKKGDDSTKPVINYSGSYSLQVPSNKLEPMSGNELEEFLYDVYWENGGRIGPDYLEKNPDFQVSDILSSGGAIENYRNGNETDWWGMLTGNGYINKHNLSLQGKNSNLSYYTSVGFTDVQGFLENDNYKKFNYRINLDAKVNDYFNFGIESFLTSSDYSGVEPDLHSAFTTLPWEPLFDEEGNYTLYPRSSQLNPFLVIAQDDSDKRFNLSGNLYADIKVPGINGLKYRINFSQNYRTQNQNRFNPYGANLTGFGYKNSGKSYDMTLDNIITYNRSFNNVHEVNATLVYGVEERTASFTNASAQNFSTDDLGYNKLDAGDPSLNKISTGKGKETSLYSMLRTLYIFKDKYLITGTVRRDGFSGFGQEKKIGIFPSLALGWVISEENFFNDEMSWMNYLKLRLSYGSAGRRAVGRYDTQAKVDVSPMYVFGDGNSASMGQRILNLANYNLGWETTTGINIGADFGLLNNKISGNIEYYSNDTKDILYNIQLPTITGFQNIMTNIGKVHNSGIELTLNSTIINTNDFRWQSSVNFSRNRNEIVSILGEGNDQNEDGKEDDLIANELFIGEPQNVNYNYEVIGMWQLADRENGTIPDGFFPGTYKLADLNNDGNISASNDRKILNYPDPSYRIGWANTINYKKFSLYFFINTIQGGKNYYYANTGFLEYSPWAKLDQLKYSNAPKDAWDYWMPENPDAKYRRPDTPSQYGTNLSPYDQRNFIRLQDLSLSYSFDNKTLERFNISNLKLFVSGKNLFTITKWEGWDPETGIGFEPGRPVMSNYTLGINLEF